MRNQKSRTVSLAQGYMAAGPLKEMPERPMRDGWRKSKTQNEVIQRRYTDLNTLLDKASHLICGQR